MTQRLSSTLFVNTPGSQIGVQHRALVVRSKGTTTRVPMESIDGVVAIGGVNLTTDCLARCAQQGIRVASLTRSGKVRFVVAPEATGNVHLRARQYQVASDPDAALDLAKSFVAGKIANGEHAVRRWGWDADSETAPRLGRIVDALGRRRQAVAGARDGDHLRGLEGDAARWYFKAMRIHLLGVELAAGMTARTRRPPLDPVNAALSFGYALLNVELVGAAQAVGLDHQVGFLHGVRSGRASLALDVLEEFRAPIVDRFVVSAFKRRQLRAEHFENMPGGAVYLSSVGRSEYFTLFDSFREKLVRHELFRTEVPRWSLSLSQMTVLARHLRGDIPYVPWICSR